MMGCLNMFQIRTNLDVQNKIFVVQIKGTHDYTESDGVISYSLKSLAFPAYIAYEVTADPGILFIVLNPDVRGEKTYILEVYVTFIYKEY